MLKRIATALWGKFESWDELRKFGLMASVFGLIIGVYWALRPIKDSIFDAIVGGHLLWQAKILSVCIIAPLVILYSKLIDKFPRQKVFYGLLLFYTVLTAFFAYAFMDPVLGLANTVASPDRYLGWLWYVFVESFGSLIVALFWVIATDITLPESAKRGFPIIALFGQIGNIFGPFLLSTKRLGLTNSAPIVAICGGLMLATILLMYYFWSTTPKNLLAGYHESDPKEQLSEPGFMEGLKLLFSNAYLLGIFFIVSVYEVIVTVIDFHFKQTTFAAFGTEGEKSGFLSDYATTVGIIATACILLGINNIQRYLGMRASLILLPLLIGLAIGLITLNPSSLQIAFWIMALSKAVNYALNQPTLKQLYIPTTKEARYKTQGWIEMFGSRSAKALASLANGLRGLLGAHAFLYATCIASLGLIGLWIAIAVSVSKTYNRAIDKNEVVC
jgi:AAA family ATP:ADP antiporter